MSAVPVLDVANLSVAFRTRNGIVKALENVSFQVGRGEMVGVVGESGSGKSVTAYTVMGILDEAGSVTAGAARFGGNDLFTLPESALREIRGRELSMVFQNPRAALNPIRKVGRQIADVLLRHSNVTRADLSDRVIDMLKAVRIPDPERRAQAYPFELSGGMCQRIMIAIALACRPALLIADEPTTGLDVTTQATIMDLIKDLAQERGMATMVITHDLGMAAEYCDRIVVMHAGHVVEVAETQALFRQPQHPYTARLMAATPKPDSDLASLVSISGGLPDLRDADLPSCRYSARCERRLEACAAPLPAATVGRAACWNPL
jgi:peptide/nickel transport system ATP-binding protein